MRADHDRAPGLEGDQDLVDRRRRGIGRGDDGRHDAERLGDLDDLLVLDAIDHAHGLHRANELVDLTRGEQILLYLVRHHAVSGLLDGEPGQRFGLQSDGLRHRRDDGVDLFLLEFGQQRLRLARGAGERPGFRDGRQVFVGGWGRLRKCHRGVPVPQGLGRIRSTSVCGLGMTWTEISSPTRLAAAAPASVAAFTAPTSPRTRTVTYPAPMYSLATRTTFAALTIASAASTEPIRPRVSTIPSASDAMCSGILSFKACTLLQAGCSPPPAV